MLGPRGLLGPDTIGVLVEGFERRAAMGVSYNYPYYERLVLDAGFAKEVDSLSGYLPGDYHLPPRLGEIAEKVKARRGLWVKGFASKEDMRAWVPRVIRVYEEAFAGTREFFPISEGELRLMADDLITVSDPQLIKLVRHRAVACPSRGGRRRPAIRRIGAVTTCSCFQACGCRDGGGRQRPEPHQPGSHRRALGQTTPPSAFCSPSSLSTSWAWRPVWRRWPYSSGGAGTISTTR